MKLLLVVDYQYDFAAEDGKLTAGKPAIEIENSICEKIRQYKENKDPVVFTLDCHYESDWKENNHPEAKAFGRHCIKGSEGYELYGKVKMLSEGCEIIEKRAYCPDIENTVLKELVEKAEEIEVCGLVTDICVFQSVIGLYTYIINNGLKTSLTVDKAACASFNEERQEWALQYMAEVIGVQIK